MKKSLSRSLAVGAAGLFTAAVCSSAVSAQAATTTARPTTYQVNLTQQNKSNASGTAVVTYDGKNVTVDLKATGLSANLAHATHIHVGGQATCPAPSADTDKDGFVSAKESEPAAGPMKVSLTTTGDTSTSSALAVDRMPKADGAGNLTYKRTFALPAGVTAADMSKATIDIHGVSALFGDKAKYDGSKKSELDQNLPFEATAPAACGKLTSAPTGAPDTGLGSTAGIEAPLTLTLGVAALIGAALVVILGRRPLHKADQE